MTERPVLRTSRQRQEERSISQSAGRKDDGESDVDSIATDSTLPSEHDSGDVFEVEQILAETKKNGGAHFLIKWAHYPEERATWEPEECIMDKGIIASWRVDLARQKAGILKAFDVEAWESKMKKLGEEKTERKARRAEKHKKIERKNLNKSAEVSSKGLSSEDDEPLLFRRSRKADKSFQLSDEDDKPLASVRRPSTDKQTRKKREKSRDVEESGSTSEEMANLRKEVQRKQVRGKGKDASKNEGETAGETPKVQRRNSEAQRQRPTNSTLDAASPLLRTCELPRASNQVTTAQLTPSHRSGSRALPQETTGPNVMSTGHQETAPATSAAPPGPRPRGRRPGSGRGGATRGGSRGRGRRGALPATSHVFSRSEVPLARKRDLIAALPGATAEAETTHPDLSKSLSHARKLEIAGRMKADRAPDLAVLGGLINPSEIKDSRSAAYQPLKPAREFRQSDTHSRQPSGSDAVLPTSAPASHRSSTARVRIVDNTDERHAQISDEPSPTVQSPVVQSPVVQSPVIQNQGPPKAQMVSGTGTTQPDAPGIGKTGNINAGLTPILRAPPKPTSNEWAFQQPALPRSFTLPSSGRTPLPTGSPEAVRPAVDRRVSTGERRKVTLSEYNARQGIEKSGHLVKQAVFGMSDPTRTLISFNGVPRSSEESWVKEINSRDVLQFSHMCSAIDFQAQPPFLGAKVLAHGSIAANTNATTSLDRTAEHLRLRLGGLVFNHLSIAILVFPTRLDEWKFLEKIDMPSASTALRYHIFELPRFCPTITGSLAGSISESAKPCPPYWSSAVEFFCSIKYESLLPSLPVLTKGQKKREEQDRDNFFLLIPQNACPSPRFLTAWLKNCKPTCKVLSSAKPGSWSAFLEHAKKSGSAGTLLVHQSLIPQIPKLPNLQRLFSHKCNFAIFSLNSFPPPARSLGLEAPVALVRSRLFPIGAAFFLTPSLILVDPMGTLRFLKWFEYKLKTSTPGTYKLLGCHGMREFLLDLAVKKATERANLVAQRKGQDIEPEAIMRDITLKHNDYRFKAFEAINEIIRNADAALPCQYDLEDLEDEERPIIYASDHIAYENEPELVLWFAGWAIMNVDKHKKFFVIGTDYTNVHKAVRAAKMTLDKNAPSVPPSTPLDNSVRWKKTGFTVVTEVISAPLFSTNRSVSHSSISERSPSPLTHSPLVYQAAQPGENTSKSDADMDMNMHAQPTSHINALARRQEVAEEYTELWELEERIAHFQKTTGSTTKQAIHYLGTHGADLKAALESYKIDPTKRTPSPDPPVQQPRPAVSDSPNRSQLSSRSAPQSGAVTEEDGRRLVPSSLRGDGSTRPEIAVRPGYVAPEDKEVWRRPSAFSMLPRNVKQNARGQMTNSRQKQVSTDESGDVMMNEADQDDTSSSETQNFPPPPPFQVADVAAGFGSSSTGMFVTENERSSSIASSPRKQDVSKSSPAFPSKATTEWYNGEESAGRGWSHIKVMGIQDAIKILSIKELGAYI